MGARRAAVLAGEVEPCINGRTVAIGAYFGVDVDSIVARLLGEQLADGGWNCETENGSVRASFATTICVLEGLLEHERAAGGSARAVTARRRGQEYLLDRRLFRRLSTGEVVDLACLRFSFPARWHYAVLRALDYFCAAGDPPDPRLVEAIILLRSKQQPDGTWLLEDTHPGAVHFSMEDGDGHPVAGTRCAHFGCCTGTTAPFAERGAPALAPRRETPEFWPSSPRWPTRRLDKRRGVNAESARHDRAGAPSSRQAARTQASSGDVCLLSGGYVDEMKYLMLMWADADAASGDEADFQAWAEFDEQVKAAGAFVANGALQPAATDARLVRTKIDGHALPGAVEQRPFALGTRQIQAFYLMECDNMDTAIEWANRLPTYGLVEVRELIDY